MLNLLINVIVVGAFFGFIVYDVFANRMSQVDCVPSTGRSEG